MSKIKPSERQFLLRKKQNGFEPEQKIWKTIDGVETTHLHRDLYQKQIQENQKSSEVASAQNELELEKDELSKLEDEKSSTLKNNETVACKLQYPDMESAVTADLSQLKMIFSIYQSYNKAIKKDEIYKEITERLQEEIDFERERKLMKIFR